MTETYDTPIVEKFHDSRELFSLRFNGGLVFLEVETVERKKYDPFTEVEYNGERGAQIEPQSYADFQRLKESENGDDILHIDSESELKVIHAAIGHRPNQIRRYTNYPEAGERLRQVENLDAPRASRGSPYGQVDGEDSPYETPTDFEELVIPPNEHLDFGFYNAGNVPVRPILNIQMATYNVLPLNPNNENDRTHIKRASQPGSPMPTYNVGSSTDQERFELDWGVEPISREEARNL